MTLDLYADEIVPVSTARPGRTGGNWVVIIFGLVLALLAIGIATEMSGCRHDVTPTPDVDPTPDVVPEGKLHVMIIEETEDRKNLPASQIAIFSSVPLRQWYEANCAKEGGITAYRCFDDDDKLDPETQIWRDLRAGVTLDPPCIVMADGKRAQQMKLPADPEATKAVLEKFKAGK